MRAALIPVKQLSEAKMRLAPALDATLRAELALAMLTDVIEACTAAQRFDMIAVVSGDSEVFWRAREAGAKPIAEPATLSGLNEGLTFAQRYLARRVAADELLILPADIPLATAGDIAAVIDALAEAPRRAAIVRARDGGTNALAMRPAEAVPMRFGPASADAHLSAAADAGIEAVELALERIAFDVDGPDDLAALPDLPVGAATRGWLDARARYVANRA